MITVMLLLLTSLLSSAGQLCQKQAALARKGKCLFWLSLAAVLLGVSMMLWLVVLQRVPVSVAYPMLSLNFVWVTLAAHFIWRETVTARHWLGIVLIILGIGVLGGLL